MTREWFAITSTVKLADSTLYLVTDGVAEFVAQVVDRDSAILHRRITETSVWPVPAGEVRRDRTSTRAKFWGASMRGAPVVKLPSASIDGACYELGKLAAA